MIGFLKITLVKTVSNVKTSDDSDSEFEGLVEKGEVHVVWHPEGNEETIKEKM